MGLKVFNSLGNRKEEFHPIHEGKVRMYVCGVTVYDLCHLGHARANLVFDFIYRYFLHLGYDVTYVRNFTDIDDKIINVDEIRTIMYDKRVADPQLTVSLKADRQCEMELITDIHGELREADALKLNYSAKPRE